MKTYFKEFVYIFILHVQTIRFHVSRFKTSQSSETKGDAAASSLMWRNLPPSCFTCVGDVALLAAGDSGEESGCCEPTGRSRCCSGDRLQLLSSSHDQLSSDVLRRGKSWSGREGGG